MQENHVTRTSLICCGRITLLWNNMIKVHDLKSLNQGHVGICTSIHPTSNTQTMRSLSVEVFHRQTTKRSRIIAKRIILVRKCPNITLSVHTALMSTVLKDTGRNLCGNALFPQTVGESVTNLLVSARNCLPPDIWRIPPLWAEHDLQFNYLQWHELIGPWGMLDILHNDGFKIKILTKKTHPSILQCKKPSQRKKTRK